MSELKHPSILKMEEYYEDSKRYYVIYDLR